MKKKLFFILFLGGIGSLNAQTVKKATNKLPNIVYIYADNLGYAELGCYGQKKLKRLISTK